MHCGNKNFDASKRELPAHLRIEKHSPGPGYYESQSTIEMKHRARDSMQECTWARVAGGSFIDIPKNNPGPAQYSPGRTLDEMHKPKSSETGFAF